MGSNPNLGIQKGRKQTMNKEKFFTYCMLISALLLWGDACVKRNVVPDCNASEYRDEYGACREVEN